MVIVVVGAQRYEYVVRPPKKLEAKKLEVINADEE